MNREVVEFKVQGSAKEPYTTTFTKQGEVIAATCTCSAAINGTFCKHRIGIFKGDSKGVISANKADVTKVASWFKGSNIELVMQQISEKEAQAESIKLEIQKLKKDLSKTLKGAA
jgi:hypothetical protein